MGVTRKPLILQHNKLRSVLSSFPHSAQLLLHHHGPRDSGAQDSGWCGLPCLHVSQGGVARVPGERGGLAQVLGGPRCLLPGGAHLDPFITYLVLKCLFLVWCMLPVQWNGADLLFNQVLFPLFEEHHKDIEDQAEKAKQSFKDKFGDFFKSDKKENGKENGKKNGVVVKTKDKPEKEEKKQN